MVHSVPNRNCSFLSQCVQVASHRDSTVKELQAVPYWTWYLRLSDDDIVTESSTRKILEREIICAQAHKTNS